MSDARFFMLSFGGYLVIVIRQKAKYRFFIVVMFYILKKCYWNSASVTAQLYMGLYEVLLVLVVLKVCRVAILEWLMAGN
jgi:hypothetical protein